MQLFANTNRSWSATTARGIRAIIAVHNTVLGPGLGGIRMWTFGDEEALTDVLRLSRGMTYKNSLAGLRLGGGKTVVIGDPRTDKTPELFRALGRVIDSLGGPYLAAEDVGTTTQDATRCAANALHHRPAGRAGGSGDPSPMTAWGVFAGSVRRSARPGSTPASTASSGGTGRGPRRRGAVRHLLAAGATVTVADIHADRVEPLRAAGAAVADRLIAQLACDVFSPCALGAVVRPETIDGFRCRVIAGAANNQLLDGSMGDALAAPRDRVRPRLRDQRRRRDQHRRGAAADYDATGRGSASSGSSRRSSECSRSRTRRRGSPRTAPPSTAQSGSARSGRGRR